MYLFYSVSFPIRKYESFKIAVFRDMTLCSQLNFNDVSEENIFYWRVQSDIRDGDFVFLAGRTYTLPRDM
jgi:hypothetical protein